MAASFAFKNGASVSILSALAEVGDAPLRA
jgi:hypothetical protein